MKKNLFLLLTINIAALLPIAGTAQINLLQNYKNKTVAGIGTFQSINFKEGGFSGLFLIPNTNGKEFWTCSDRGVNIDAANANTAACRPTYDKIYGFPNYAPKIHRIRLHGDSIQILQTITIKRPGGTNASGLLNPTGFGSTAIETASTDTVMDCANFSLKTVAKDVWGIDAEGITVDNNGYFWICEEGGPTIWKINANGVVVKRFTPYANMPSAQTADVQIDSVFKYRKNNRGFEGITITPNGKIYAIIQSPLLYPTKTVGENTTIHRILEIDPATNNTRMFAYVNDGIIGASGANQIRLRDWKIGDIAAINDTTFLVLEAALRGTTDIKRMYKINIANATPILNTFYNGATLEALTDSAGLAANNITPVKKTLFMDLLANGWPASLEKAEGLAIINDSTIAIGNDNDYGQASPTENGIAAATNILSHVYTYSLKGDNKIAGFNKSATTISQGKTGINSSQSPYLVPSIAGANFTSIITVNDAVNGYKMVGIPDGLGAYDNNNGTFTVLLNHELSGAVGIVRAHGAKGAFVSKWIINKADLSVVSGEDLVKKVNLWNASTSSYTEYSATNPSALATFNRFCSADLPPVTALYNSATGLGTQERIFLTGEESGAEGRAFAHIVTGSNAGTSYELPYIGKMSWENALANPATGNKTVVAGTDDATPGQVYFYIGTKTNTGNEIEKAGLSNGKLYSPVVNSMPLETNALIPTAGTTFTMADLGTVQNINGATLQANSVAAGATQFLRPEDGLWDLKHPNDFYFNTTNGFGNPSRVWKLHFTNLADLTQGGTITAVLDGTEGQQMLDNMGIDNNGNLLLQEDVGNNAHIGKIWQYNIATDKLTEIAKHDTTRFLTGGANFLTQDEESSGIIDVQSILGAGMFLLTDQAHYPIPGEVVEGGQLLAFYNPLSINVKPSINITNPVAGGIYNAGENISFATEVTDADGNIEKVEFYSNGIKIAEDTTAPYEYLGKQVEAGNYKLLARAFDNDGNISASDTVNVTVIGCTGAGSISAAAYGDIPGIYVDNLTSNINYPNQPTVTAQLTLLETPSNIADNFGVRMHGYICAPITGNYTFYIASNENSELWLSTNDNATNKIKIAYLNSAVAPRAWYTFFTQKSLPITLIKGVRYYIEVLYKEASGADHAAVAWQLPNGNFEGPIPGNRLSPINDSLTTSANANAKIFANELAALQATVIVVTPNPTSAYFNITVKGNSAQPFTIIIKDMLGRHKEIHTNIKANSTIQLGHNYASGIYVAEIIQGTKKIKKKLIKN